MKKRFERVWRAVVLGLAGAAHVFLLGVPAQAGELLPPGFRPAPLGIHALMGGRVVVKPGEVLEGATILIRDGRIQAVGPTVAAPADARVWDMKGTTIYAGFIDPYLVFSGTNAPVSTTDSEPNEGTVLTAGGVGFFGAPAQGAEAGHAGPGYEVAKVTPQFRALRGYSPKEKLLVPLRENGFTAGVVAPARGIIRGTSALVQLADRNPNETTLKADVFQHVVFETGQGEGRSYPASLMGVIAVVRQCFFDASHDALDWADYLQHPLARRRPEFNPALEALRPAAEGKMRVVFEPGSALMADRAARVGRELGLDFCLVSCGQEWRRPDLAKATAASFIVPLDFPALPKLPEEDDWDQVTLDQLRAWDWAPENAALLRRQGLEIALTTYGLEDKSKFRPNLRLALDRGLPETEALAALTTVPARLCGVESQLGTIEPGKLANLAVVEGASYFDPEAKVREVWIEGRVWRAPAAAPKREGAEEAKPPQETDPARSGPAGKTVVSDTKGERAKQLERDLRKTRVARSPLEDRGILAAPASVLIRGATIWTCGPQGVLTNAQMRISGGKVREVGYFQAEADPDLLIIEGHGLHVSPGIIDCHSHTAILGAVNEATLPSTAMVRISDVVNSETGNLYEQLAGGVTTVNLLHGSANPIGGQNCVIKLRDGASPTDLILEGAPPGIKFALGENVKQSGWGDRFVTRFPQTRMGVRTFIANRFTAAQQYLADCASCKAAGTVAPRRDLELEAIGEILQGKRWIHCHSYRQDEILMLMRLMEGFGVRVGTFQHVLEGYKIADEIAKHGAGASSFSDWWAYKFEVYDAIPYNGSLMRGRGVSVSFNSDSSELARRLYTEAAKAVKYGGTPEVEALKFVTLNPARQLRIEASVGSLEPGKDADFVLWSKAPLDSRTVCLQTWIEGKKYFDLELAAGRAARLAKEKADLLAKARKLGKPGAGDPTKGGNSDAFFRHSLEHEFDGQDRHCLDEEQ
jgi:imidazolonepropionase-like amidohydrolase